MLKRLAPLKLAYCCARRGDECWEKQEPQECPAAPCHPRHHPKKTRDAVGRPESRRPSWIERFGGVGGAVRARRWKLSNGPKLQTTNSARSDETGTRSPLAYLVMRAEPDS
ncbi:hypothetical protein PF003_g28173 [Phytophthora fragariae]|nr:hypothetical protein PF003_g28173 [Phytophthora fragariae]